MVTETKDSWKSHLIILSFTIVFGLKLCENVEANEMQVKIVSTGKNIKENCSNLLFALSTKRFSMSLVKMHERIQIIGPF